MVTANGIETGSERPRCYNRADFKMVTRVQDGWTEDGRRSMVDMSFRMSLGCPLHGPHGEAAIHRWNCSGCKWLPETNV